MSIRRASPIMPPLLPPAARLFRLMAGVSLTALLALASPASVQAQSNSDQDRHRGAKITRNIGDAASTRSETDPERVDDSYQPRGVEFGQFLFFPVLDVSTAYNSNIFASAENRKGDLVTRVAPEFRLRSRFKSHALNVRGRLEQFVYAEHGGDNRLDGNLQIDGRYDIQRAWEASFFVDAGQVHEDRGSPDDVGGKEPAQTRNVTTQLQTKAEFGRFGFRAEGGLQRRVYFNTPAAGPAGVIRQSDRDRVEAYGLLRGSYEMFPGYSAVLEGGADIRTYDDPVDRAGFDRSNEGRILRAGIGVDISQLVRGDVLIGYTQQDYDDARLSDPSGLSIKASFNWTPSRMTVVVPSLERSVYETTTAGASGMVRTGGSLTIRHELQRNIVLTALGSLHNDLFDGTDREHWTYDSRLRAIWALAPEYYVGGEIGYRKRTANNPGQEFGQSVILLRFGVQI